MKKILFVMIACLFLTSGVAVAQQRASDSSKAVTQTFSTPTLTTSNTYTTLSLPEATDTLTVQGKPLMPMDSQIYAYPFGTRINSVTVTMGPTQTMTVPGELAPTPAMAGLDSVLTTSDTSTYGTQPYPSAWYSYTVSCGLYDGVDQVLVTLDIYPVKYLPATHQLQYSSSATVNIQTQAPPTTPRPSGRDAYQLVIIAPSAYSSQLAPLVTHKISRGISTKLVTMTDITSGTYFPATGRDDAEKMKYFIKNAIESWETVSVLLFGGIDELPIRDTHVYIADDPEYGDEIFSTDLYFADIYNGTGGFSSWDTNNNNVFGEFNWEGNTDKVDLHPDLFLTRLPATETSEVTTIVNKIIGYETTPGYQQNWFPYLVVCGGDSFPDEGTDINEGEYANQKVEGIMTSFTPTELWVTNGKLTSLSPTGVATIKSAINAGAGFVDFSGHGATYIWATHPHTNFNIWVPTPAGGIDNNDILTLSNGNKLPIVTVEACSTAKYEEDATCYNFAFLYATNGGAIGTFGCTGIGYSYVGTGVTTGLSGKMGLDTYRSYKNDHAATFGDMYVRAINHFIKTSMQDGDMKTVEEWQPFGDPTLAIGEASQPPAKPTAPSGELQGNAGSEYSYSTKTTDPEGDKISYLFDWGDGTKSAWVGPLTSGTTASATKTWSKKGTYAVKVIAKDTHGSMSLWSDPVNVTMPYVPNRPLLQFFEHFLQQHPNAFPVLRRIMGF